MINEDVMRFLLCGLVFDPDQRLWFISKTAGVLKFAKLQPADSSHLSRFITLYFQQEPLKAFEGLGHTWYLLVFCNQKVLAKYCIPIKMLTSVLSKGLWQWSKMEGQGQVFMKD